MLTAAAGRGEGKASVSVVLPKEGTEWRIGDADDVRDFRAGKVLFSGFNCRINRFPLMGKDIDAGCVSVSCWKWNGVRVCNPAQLERQDAGMSVLQQLWSGSGFWLVAVLSLVAEYPHRLSPVWPC